MIDWHRLSLFRLEEAIKANTNFLPPKKRERKERKRIFVRSGGLPPALSPSLPHKPPSPLIIQEFSIPDGNVVKYWLTGAGPS